MKFWPLFFRFHVSSFDSFWFNFYPIFREISKNIAIFKIHIDISTPLFFCYQFYLHSALGRPSTTFPVQISAEIIKYFQISACSNLCNSHLQVGSLIFPTYVAEVGVFFFYFIRRIPNLFFQQIKQKNRIKSKKNMLISAISRENQRPT